jgi:hypothetical protein
MARKLRADDGLIAHQRHADAILAGGQNCAFDFYRGGLIAAHGIDGNLDAFAQIHAPEARS